MKKIYLTLLILFALSNFAQAQNANLEDVIEEVNPSVVSITAENDETQSLGAGFIISADGYVVTNAHVTADAAKITISTIENDTFEAQLIGADEKTDIALLKVVHPLNFEPAEFADSETIRVGNSVFAIGNPFGLGNSVSSGIISAKERDIEKGPYDSFIQTDAAINQGNSGGPLFNLQGQIVGMNTAIFSTDGKDTGVGFAVPSNIVQWVAEQLKQNGKVIRGWIGIGVQEIRSTNTDQKHKLVVASMLEDSPALAAGIEVGDVLEEVGEIMLKTPRHFSLGIAQTPPDTVLPVTVNRDGNLLNFEVKVAEMKTNSSAKTKKSYNIDAAESTADIKNNSEAADFPELGIKAIFDEENQEFVITALSDNSDAAAKGISVGDKFNIINHHKVYGIEDLRIRIKQALPNGVISIQFIGEDTVDTISLKLKDTK